MRFNEKRKQDGNIPYSFPPYSVNLENSFHNKRLNPIDVLLVDKQSRLTLTKKVKRIIPLNPEDKIAVYQDIYNKDIVLKVQYRKGQNTEETEEEKKLENWVLTIRREVSSSPNAKKIIGINNNKDESNKTINSEDDRNYYYQSNQITETSSKYKLKNNEMTLLATSILLVDDEPELLMTFNALLKHEGYINIKTFSSSKATIKYLLDLTTPLHYNLAIIDIRMPDINGIQLYQILKILNPAVKIIFLTGLDAVAELTSIYPEIKPTDILKKPVNSYQFITAVNDKVFSLASAYG